MATRKKSVTDYLESRIQFYRYCTAGLFVLGLLAGAGVLFGKTSLFPVPFLERHPALTSIILCFAVSFSGIATASAYRGRIRYIVERGNRILQYADGGSSFPKPLHEEAILEVQALFGILFVLAAAVCCIDYPVSVLPAYLDFPLLRLALLAGFFLFCGISTRLEKNNFAVRLNSIEDFVRSHQKQARVRGYKPAPVPVGYVPGNVLRERRAAAMDRQHPIRP